ncbi:MAG TPA: glycine betaine ABC transporter substrate-binding protein, partial [Acidimicrobiales bacterium]|nr:glycine betaine ABC transporter substrate-binding protein [Acidimicrobiales bacterium]
MLPRRPVPMAIAAVVWLVALVSVAAGCTGSSPPAGSPAPPARAVVVASFNFPESELLAEIYGQALAAQGIPVRIELDLGTRELVLPAFQQGLVDVVPEYIGSALQALQTGEQSDMADRSVVAARLGQALASWHGVLLDPSPAQDQNGLVVTRQVAAEYGLQTISDLRRVSGRMTLTAPPECPQRPYCLQGLERVYGLSFRSQLPLATEGGRVTALEQHVADVALLFTTNPDLASHDL